MLTWKRPEAGHYTSGTWHVKGTGTNWDLYDGRKHITSATSKKACQQHAENPPPTEETEIAPEPELAKAPKRGKLELDSVLASLRLEVDQLALRISSLDTTISGLKDAVLILAKHAAKLGKVK